MDNCSEEIEFFNRWNDKELIKKLNNVVSSEFVRVSCHRGDRNPQKAKESGVSFKYPLGWGETSPPSMRDISPNSTSKSRCSSPTGRER